MTAWRTEFWKGVKAELPLMVGVIPFGLIFGVLAVGSGILPIPGQAMSSIIFAGSAQFVASQMIATGAPALVIILTIGVVNLRHALYSASLAPYLKLLKPGWKWLLAYLLTDEAYAMTILHYVETDAGVQTHPGGSSKVPPLVPDLRHWFFLGAGITLWSIWQVSTALGIFLGAAVPTSWSLDFTLALTFIAIVVPVLRNRPSVLAGGVAGIAAILGRNLPFNLGLLSAALLGIVVGVWVETRK
jgi:predicted branched-subunit amino acid permease